MAAPYRGRRRAVVVGVLLLVAGLTAWPAWYSSAYGLRGRAVTTTVVAAEPGLCRDNKHAVTCWKGLVEVDGRRTTVSGGPWIPFDADPARDLVGRTVTIQVAPGRQPVTRLELRWAAGFTAVGAIVFLLVAFGGRNWLLGRTVGA